MLNVNRAARTIDGRAVPFGVIGVAPMRMPRRYPLGSLIWDEWPPLLIDHNHSLRVGRVIALQPLSFGLWATFQVIRGPKGDRALEMAAHAYRGLSIDTADEESRIADDGVLECISARVIEISLTKSPVFP